MSVLTEQQRKRISEIDTAICLDRDLKTLTPPIMQTDVKMLIERIRSLDDTNVTCADEIINFAHDRLVEDLRSQKEWLQECVEQLRTAELMVMEATHALTAVKALKDGAIYASGDGINRKFDDVLADYRKFAMLPDVVEERTPRPAAHRP